MGKRVTQHNGRKGKNGVYNPKHNDRNFDVSEAPHIDEDRGKGNLYWHCYGDEVMTFEEAERRFYEENFSKALDLQNGKYIARRQHCYTKTMDEYRGDERTCPEEQILGIGKKGNSVGADLLVEIVREQIRWEEQMFPNVKVLNVALHVDEGGAPHIQKRQVWTATDKNGNLVVSQSKALKEMGITGQDREVVDREGNTKILKWGSRYNNAKQEYTRLCREHLEGLCREHGIELEEGRLEQSETGQSLLDYKAKQATERAERAETRAEKLEQEAREKAEQVSSLSVKKEELEQDIASRVLVARPDGYQVKNPLVEEVKGYLAGVKEDKGFFGGKGTCTISKAYKEKIERVIDGLEVASREAYYEQSKRAKAEERIEELVKENSSLSSSLSAYEELEKAVGSKVWGQVKSIARQEIARQKQARQEQKPVKKQEPYRGR